LEDSIWSVAPQSDRMGIRLHGPALSVPTREILSEGVTLGALQVPPSGQPIVLFVDHQTSGGYPKLACVIQADHARLGQLHPGRRFRLAWVTLEAARQALREQEAALREQEAALREQEAGLREREAGLGNIEQG
jgi:antagonist of KipI